MPGVDRRAAHAPFDVVIPTIARPSLRTLLEALAASSGPLPRRIFVVSNGTGSPQALLAGLPEPVASRLRLLHCERPGPAAARNVGWRASDAEWIAFLDDDVVPGDGWLADLAGDLALPDEVAGTQGRVHVPVPGRRATDRERTVRLLEDAKWTTADMAYRRVALEEVGGFDERFSRAYREDSDLALRVLGRGYGLVAGSRQVTHPVQPADPWISVRLQAGNADDVLMRALHGDWQSDAPRWGRLRRHLAVSAAAGVSLCALAVGRRRLAAAGAALWAAGTAEFACRRIAAGPADAREVAVMLVTSVAIPPVASGWWVVGLARRRRLLAGGSRSASKVVHLAPGRRLDSSVDGGNGSSPRGVVPPTERTGAGR